MSDHVEFPDRGGSERTTITDGFFEQEVYLSRTDTAAFLRDLADQLEADTTFTLSTDEWEIPFEYADPIEVEIEFAKGEKRELEIELEFTEPQDGGTLDVS